MGKVNMAAMESKREELKNRGGGGSDFAYDKLEKGKNIRRILPPKGDSDVFYSEGYMHFSLGADGKTAVTCLSTFNKKCPICDHLASIKSSTLKEDKAMLKDCRKVKRVYISVLNRDDSSDEEVPKILPIGPMILKQIIEIICDPDYGDITDFNEGRDVTITKSGSGMETEYSTLAKPKTSITTESYTEEELDELLPDLDSMFVEKSAAELEAILNGEELEETEEENSEDDDIDYEDMELDDLTYLCKERGITVPKNKLTKSKLIALLESYDEENEGTSDSEEEDSDKPPYEEDDDDLMASVKSAVKNKKSGAKR